jgi:hypothetical protein
VVLAGLTILIGVGAGTLFALSERAAAQLIERRPYIEAVQSGGAGGPR